MLDVSEHIQIPDDEFQWSYVRAGGPGGQNVNKVSSKAVLRWDAAQSPSLPPEVKSRLFAQYRSRITTEGKMVLSSQRYRDQERNRQDCLDKLRELLLQVATPPRPRKATRPSRGAKLRRLADKRRRANIKGGRRTPTDA
jgi:ribosome-associated protein